MTLQFSSDSELTTVSIPGFEKQALVDCYTVTVCLGENKDMFRWKNILPMSTVIWVLLTFSAGGLTGAGVGSFERENTTLSTGKQVDSHDIPL